MTVAFDFKKEYRTLYSADLRPSLVEVPKLNYIAVRGKGDPNEPQGEYQRAIQILYAVAYTLKMSYRTPHQIAGFYAYVVPPLEGFWQQDGTDGMDYRRKSDLTWVSVIRLPDFITRTDFDWAVQEAGRKKKMDCSPAEFLTVKEGLCVQAMHIGPYDTEPETVAQMVSFVQQQELAEDFSSLRLHHEIYLSNAQKVQPEKLKTIIRHPVRRIV